MTDANNAAAAKLSVAVLANSRDLVDLYLGQGMSPNVKLGDVIPALEDVMEVKYRRDIIPKHVKVAKATASKRSAPTLLHLAVINCFHQGCSSDSPYSSDLEMRNDALAIVRSLLKAGADPSTLAPNMVLCNLSRIGDDETGVRITTDRSGAGTDTLDLASFLKKHAPSGTFKSEQESLMNSAIREIAAAWPSVAEPQPLPTVLVPKAAVAVWRNLLLSEDFSDVKFLCEDGVALPAHRSVLAAASPYFSTVFRGPWRENHVNGEWATSNPSHIMKAVLGFIYTGRIDSSLLDSDPRGVLAVASEYDLDQLRKLSEASCVCNLSVKNVKATLQLANLHSLVSLKRACFGFIRKNAANVLTDPDMIRLSTEDAELWGELAKAIATKDGSDSTRAKRQRTS